MANFYARDRGYSDYHLELPIEKMAQKELKKGQDKIDSIKSIAALVKNQSAGHIKALNNKYSATRQNLKENHALTQANYKLIFEQEQLNAKREFENLQRSRGNPGPKQVQGLGSLLEMAPALMEMVGSYVEQEKIHRNKTTTNLILDKDISGATAGKWAENRELIASNSLEAKIFAEHESAKLGVPVSTEEMLAIIDLYGERDMAAMTAFAHTSVDNYPLFLEDPKNQSMEIVLDGGVTTTWGEARRGQDPAVFASAQAQMRGHFLEKHQISITDQVPGILGDIGKGIRQVEAQELGRFHNQLNQYNDNKLETHNATRWQNAFDGGAAGIASHVNTLSYEYIDTVTNKPDRNRAFNELTNWIERGLKEGTISSRNVQDAIDANGGRGGQWRTKKLDTLLEQARIQEYNSENFELKVQAARQRRGREAAIEHFYSQEGFGGKLPISQAQYFQMLLDGGLTRESASQVITATGTSGGLKAQMPEEKHKAWYEAGEQGVLKAIKSKVVNNPANKIVLKDKESVSNLTGYDLLEQNLKIKYSQYFSQLLRERGAGDQEHMTSLTQEAKDLTLKWLDDNPDYTTLSSSTRIDENTGEEIQIPNSERGFIEFTGPSKEAPTLSLTLEKLNNHPGVSPRNVILGIEQGNYEPVVDAREIGSYLQGGSWNVLAFENSSLGRALSVQTGLPASYILAIHAEKQGFKPLSDEEYIDLEEFDNLPEGIKKVMNCNSSDSGDVCRAAMQPEFRRPPSYARGIGGTSLNPGFQQMSWEQNPIDTANLQSTTESGQPRRISIQQRAELLAAVGFPQEIIPVMIAISAGESGGDAGAHNPNRNTGDNSYGLWQINMIDTLGPSRRKNLGLTDNRQLFDPLTNARAAKAIYDSQGLNAWTVYSKGTYKKYLPEVQTTLQRWY